MAHVGWVNANDLHTTCRSFVFLEAHRIRYSDVNRRFATFCFAPATYVRLATATGIGAGLVTSIGLPRQGLPNVGSR